MKRAVLPILTLMLGIGIGALAGGRHRENRSSGGTGAATGSRQATTRDTGSPGSVALLRDFLQSRSPADLTADEAFELLLPWLARDPADESHKNTLEGLKANNQFRLLMDTLPLPVLEEVLGLARKRGLPLENVRDLFAAWAVRDWNKAMASSGSGPESRYLRSAAIALLAESDPEGAELLYQEMLLKNPVDYDEDTVARLSKLHAGNGLEDLLAFFDTIPEISEPTPYRLALDNLPAADVSAFMDELHKRQADGEWIPMNGLVGDLMNKHPELFKQWSAKLPLEGRNRVKLTASLNLHYRGREEDSRKLLEECVADMAGQEKNLIVSNLITFANSPALVEEITNLLPQDRRPEPGELVPNPHFMTRDDLARPWTLVKLFDSPEDQADYLADHFDAYFSQNGFTPKDLEILSLRLQQTGLTGDNETKVRTILDKAKRRIMEARNSINVGD